MKRLVRQFENKKQWELGIWNRWKHPGCHKNEEKRRDVAQESSSKHKYSICTFDVMGVRRKSRDDRRKWLMILVNNSNYRWLMVVIPMVEDHLILDNDDQWWFMMTDIEPINEWIWKEPRVHQLSIFCPISVCPRNNLEEPSLKQENYPSDILQSFQVKMGRHQTNNPKTTQKKRSVMISLDRCFGVCPNFIGQAAPKGWPNPAAFATLQLRHALASPEAHCPPIIHQF